MYQLFNLQDKSCQSLCEVVLVNVEQIWICVSREAFSRSWEYAVKSNFAKKTVRLGNPGVLKED